MPVGSPPFSCHPSVRLKVATTRDTLASLGQPAFTFLLGCAHPTSWRRVESDFPAGLPPPSPFQPGKRVLPEKVQTRSSLCEGAAGPHWRPASFSFMRGSAWGAPRPYYAPSHQNTPQNFTVVNTAPGSQMPITPSSSSIWQRPPSDPEDNWESAEILLLCNRKLCFLE